jgi:hypothetical protein
MNGRSNLKSAPHCALKKRRTFCVFRYVPVIAVAREIESACQSNPVIAGP